MSSGDRKGRHGGRAARPEVLRCMKFREDLQWLARMANYKLGSVLSVRFEIRTRFRQRWGTPHTLRPDLDNLIKNFKDALATNDAYVWRYRDCEKVWGEKGRIIVSVELP